MDQRSRRLAPSLRSRQIWALWSHNDVGWIVNHVGDRNDKFLRFAECPVRHGTCYAGCVMTAGSLRSLLCLVLALAGCNSPTLPLPPPAPPAVTSVTNLNGQAVILGDQNAVEPRAHVWCVNQVNKSSADSVADAYGSYLLSVLAATGNTVECWQQVDHQVSDSITIVVPAPAH